ncbi:MAG: hypothetical protein KIT44_07955 [Opitutaceae bacterium]|nr:hypothetical protein [Opitutaceae bacterium]
MPQSQQVWEKLHSAFRMTPGAQGKPVGSDAYNQAFNEWYAPAERALGLESLWGNWAALPGFISDPSVQPAQVAQLLGAAAAGPEAAANHLISAYGTGVPAGAVGESVLQFVNRVMPGAYELQSAEENVSLPLEQALLDRVLSDYILPDLDRDQQRRAEAQGSLDRINRSIDEAILMNRGALDGTRLQEEYAMADDTAGRLAASAAQEAADRLAVLDEQKAALEAALQQMSQDRTGALDGETAQLRAALGVLEQERGDALAQLEGARVAAAESRVAGINQGLEVERDRLAAADAMKGYVGGSSMQDAAMTRAAIGARQDAAIALGEANVANATDRRALGDEIARSRFDIEGRDASGRRSITDETAATRFNLATSDANNRMAIGDAGAAGRREASDLGTTMRAGYFDNDYLRRIEASLMPATLEGQRLSLQGVADEAGYSGLRRSLDTLNWWAGANNPPSARPFQETASQFGNDLAGLGAGITSAAMSYGNANDWWKKPKAEPTKAQPQLLF